MIKSRIAPTPSGYLHVGNLYNFLFTYLLTRKLAGKLLLRIDDGDTERIRETYVSHLFDTLAWLGIGWDEGPRTVAEVNQYSQLHKQNNYLNAITALIEKGVLFACSCSRNTLMELGNAPNPCLQHKIPFALNYNWRLNTTNISVNVKESLTNTVYEMNLHEAIREPVIYRKNGLAAYQICSLVDDVEAGVNLIVRGKDLLPSTAVQLFLAEQLQYQTFLQTQFLHHNLLLDSSGQKLSKSVGNYETLQINLKQSSAMVYQGFCQWLQLPYSNDIIEISELQHLFNQYFNWPD
jgi:glutamyl-tRNA synthetase